MEFFFFLNTLPDFVRADKPSARSTERAHLSQRFFSFSQNSQTRLILKHFFTQWCTETKDISTSLLHPCPPSERASESHHGVCSARQSYLELLVSSANQIEARSPIFPPLQRETRIARSMGY